MHSTGILLNSIVPLIALLAGLWWMNARGPSWAVENSDPDYIYFFNSLLLADHFKPVWHTDHPGTPSQVFGAVTLRLSHLLQFHGNDPFVFSVLKNPESYMRNLVVVGAALNAAMLFFLGFALVKIGMRPILAIASQVFCALSPAVVMHSFGRFAAEPLLFFFSLGSCIFWAYSLREDSVAIEIRVGKRETSILLSIALSLIFAGFACGVKITAFPLLLLGVFTLRTMAQKIIGASIFVISFFVATVVTTPWRTFFGFFAKLLTHKGRYGGGGAWLGGFENICNEYG
ncbi:MAG: hypothetical protein J0L75_02840 [Spirochaetes bacterium]|nr:hypothetical protein [Spirochaetota bacterium]